jgi:hypothetical protein
MTKAEPRLKARFCISTANELFVNKEAFAESYLRPQPMKLSSEAIELASGWL